MKKPIQKLPLLWGAIMFLTPMLVWAANLTVPNSFSANTPIKSADMNANFAAVQTAVNTKQDAIVNSCGAGQAISAIAAAGGAETCVAIPAAGAFFGESLTGSSASGNGFSVNNNTGTAVYASSNPTSSSPTILAQNPSNTSGTIAIEGEIQTSTPGAFSIGVWGANAGTFGSGIGVEGSQNGSGWGVYGTVAGGGIGVNASAGAGGVGVNASAGAGGVAVKATTSGVTDSAVQIDRGALRVTGAGIDTSTAAFYHVATAASITGSGYTYGTHISNPMTDGDPNALLIVTMNYNTPGGTQYVYDPHPISVYWNSVKNGWDIFNSDLAVMPPNAVFNVLVVKH